jgi:hypothetical protein
VFANPAYMPRESVNLTVWRLNVELIETRPTAVLQFSVSNNYTYIPPFETFRSSSICSHQS